MVKKGCYEKWDYSYKQAVSEFKQRFKNAAFYLTAPIFLRGKTCERALERIAEMKPDCDGLASIR
ncbi:MAG: hypothetical protein ACO1NO_11275 [Burkholderiaceae bacterium]